MSGSGTRVVFAVEDGTSYRTLEPVAETLAEECTVEFLFLDRFIEAAADDRSVDIDKSSVPFPYRDVDPYIKRSAFGSMPRSLPKSVVQRLAVDAITHRAAYDVDGYLRDADPDLVVSAVDQCPFLRHLVAVAHDRAVGTATVQHGIYEYALDVDRVSNRPLFPNVTGEVGLYERVKRRVGFRYGVTEYAHPYTDAVLTLGEFFTERIARFRQTYPCFGKTTLETTGSPEFDGPVTEYDGDVESVLFLSQQQFESGLWGRREQDELVTALRRLDESVPVTVRPHPKDGAEKVAEFADALAVDTVAGLSECVADYDAVLTVNSTALFEGAVQGKACGVLQLPWYEVGFEPFTHDHVVRVDPEDPTVVEAAEDRSARTQSDYLDRFCYMPGTDSTTDTTDSVEAISTALRELV